MWVGSPGGLSKFLCVEFRKVGHQDVVWTFLAGGSVGKIYFKFTQVVGRIEFHGVVGQVLIPWWLVR